LRSSSGEDGDGTLLNFVVEIPKRTKAKMEVATEEQPYTPIKQDTKNGKLRYYPQVAPSPLPLHLLLLFSNHFSQFMS
jgi:inorganic pyrophosphatase